MTDMDMVNLFVNGGSNAGIIGFLIWQYRSSKAEAITRESNQDETWKAREEKLNKIWEAREAVYLKREGDLVERNDQRVAEIRERDDKIRCDIQSELVDLDKKVIEELGKVNQETSLLKEAFKGLVKAVGDLKDQVMAIRVGANKPS